MDIKSAVTFFTTQFRNYKPTDFCLTNT